MSTLIKYSLINFIAVILLFVGLMYQQNGITMIVTMHSPQQNILNPKIYFAGDNQGFSEYNSRQAIYQNNNQYHFSIPNINTIRTMRFDPSTKAKRNITIQNIRIKRINWFKILRYTIPLTQITSGHQIKDFTHIQNTIHFNTTGTDPQLSIDFKVKKTSKSSILNLELFFLSLLIVMLLGYIYSLYKKTSLDDSIVAKLILYSIFLGFILFKTLYYKENIRFGYPPDETMHLKYINYVQNTPYEIVPQFEKMPHYLSHPPLYYQFLSLAHDKNISQKENIHKYRTLSMMLYFMTVLLILYLGFSTSIGILGHFVYLSVLTAIPMHSYLGGSITNDTLAMLGAVLAIIGFKRLLEENYHTLTYFILGLGAFLAYFSKLTAALLLFFALVFFLIQMIYTKKWIQITKNQLLLLALFLAPILYYQASIMLEYHALVPTYNHTHPKAYLTSGFFVPEQYRLHLNLSQWFERMLHYIKGGWFGIHSHHSFGHAQWSGVMGLVVAHILAIFAFFFRCKEANRSYCILGKMTLFAVFAVLVVQFIFSYKSHLSAGYLGGLQPRYLLPFMFAFAIMASLFVERFKQFFLFNIFIIIMCIHTLYADFFYFLQYYQ